MERLKRADVRSLLDFLRGLYAFRDLDSLIALPLSALPGIISADSTSYHEIQPDRAASLNRFEPAEVDSVESGRTFERLTGAHPVLMQKLRIGEGRAFKTSDFLTRRQLHRTRLYNEVYRPMGVEEQVGILITLRPPLVALALRRSRRSSPNGTGLCSTSSVRT